MSSASLSISVQQFATTVDPARNLELVLDAVRRGAETGARVVVLPEASLVRFGAAPAAHAEPIDGPWASAVQQLAKDLGVIVLVGTFQPAADGRVRNTILVTGENIHSGYDKIHLYDAYGFSESADVEPGNEPFTFEVDGVTVGVATCYDVRFPELFRELADRGAQVIIVTAHWGAGDGKIDAWRLLNQARAIDSTTWVVACDQADASTAGIEEPTGPRFGVGHSLVVSPMGVVLQELDEKVGQLDVTVDVAAVEKARQVIPVLANRRLGVAV
jgi:predicted amidohydrolase